ncbi:MAG: ABC transporter substrate binding protein [Chloroflexi bacterium]|nr:ABC transporter substrate binding protein [Chloroflexota bacterium]
MFRKCILTATLALALLLALEVGGVAAQAQTEGKPRIGILAYQTGATYTIVKGVLDTLFAYGYVNPEAYSGEGGYSTENPVGDDSPIELQMVFPPFGIELAREAVASALDQEPDMLVTFSTPLTVAALNATFDMENPPAIFFADVYNPYNAGIADAPCIKPAHVIGLETNINYAEILPVLQLQIPDLQTIGTLHNSGDASGIYGASQIAELGEALGLTVVQSAVASAADLALAAEGLVGKGVEAFLLPMDYTTLAGMPLISTISNDNGIPVLYANVDSLFTGATIGAGFYQYYDNGNRLGLLLTAYLNGELDIAASAIAAQEGDMIVGINQAMAAMQNYEFSQPLQDRVDFAIVPMEAGAAFPVRIEIYSEVAETEFHYASTFKPLEAREESDRAFLAGLECTAERIAEQQAELDAMGG